MEQIFAYITKASEESDNFSDKLSASSSWLLNLLGLMLIGFILHIISKKILNKNIELFSRTAKNKANKILIEEEVTKPLDYLLPGLAVLFLSPFVLRPYPNTLQFVDLASHVLIALSIINLISNIINGVSRILSEQTKLRNKPIKSIAQLLKTFNYIFGTLFLISIIINKDITNILTALGALMAIIILIFKDTILGFSSSLQIYANDIVREGDWITFPEHGADGTVTHISLTVVKIINFDNTITSIPTYSFTTKSFQNWRGMSDSGMRRIKRSIRYNINSVKFVEIETYIHLLQNIEIEPNKKYTNLGLFRLYVENLIDTHPKVAKNATSMVRQLQSNEFGVGLEIYCFANDTKWENYEILQAEILEDLFAISPAFDLEIYQRPSTLDFHRNNESHLSNTY